MNDEQWLALKRRLEEQPYLWVRIVALIDAHGEPQLTKQALLAAGVAAADVEEVMHLQPKANAFLARYSVTPEAIEAVARAVIAIWGQEARDSLHHFKIKPKPVTPPT